MSAVHGPTVGRRRLRSALRAAREAAGLTQEQVAAEMEWSLSKIIRIEAGAVGVSPIDTRALLKLYGVTAQPRVDELVTLSRSTRARRWWSSFAGALPASYMAYIGLEAETSSVLCYTPTKLPGLFQTEAYAEKASRRDRTGTDEQSRVEVRLTRQREVLGKDDPPHITAVIDEAVVRRIASDPRTKREQLERLVSLSGEPNITIQVLPFTVGVDAFPNPFAILQFPDPADDDVMFVESGLADDVVDQPELVGPYRDEFERLRELALSPADTRDMIKKIVGELD
ncbi:helix-turn-helix domain-containing protein [Phytohabitans rumicis]|uniref:Transcriptional regulator n=1 Tax=Phytohabitans rumicis TaxID=1076125 RepID=A0A6V8LCZ8_9ACTN|nr:helix-turn-helix transcriptional regulator [Phytohabitans rumicis]GFJ91877.1 transcriptional regulator [Phytohabitans rumicis]